MVRLMEAEIMEDSMVEDIHHQEELLIMDKIMDEITPILINKIHKINRFKEISDWNIKDFYKDYRVLHK